jgi:hypothetical protein
MRPRCVRRKRLRPRSTAWRWRTDGYQRERQAQTRDDACPRNWVDYYRPLHLCCFALLGFAPSTLSSA